MIQLEPNLLAIAARRKPSDLVIGSKMSAEVDVSQNAHKQWAQGGETGGDEIHAWFGIRPGQRFDRGPDSILVSCEKGREAENGGDHATKMDRRDALVFE